MVLPLKFLLYMNLYYNLCITQNGFSLKIFIVHEFNITEQKYLSKNKYHMYFSNKQ